MLGADAGVSQVLAELDSGRIEFEDAEEWQIIWLDADWGVAGKALIGLGLPMREAIDVTKVRSLLVRPDYGEACVLRTEIGRAHV